MWSIALVAKETRLVVGSSDRQLRVWAVEHVDDAQQEVGGATDKPIIGEKRPALSYDDGIEMEQNDVTEGHVRNVKD